MLKHGWDCIKTFSFANRYVRYGERRCALHTATISVILKNTHSQIRCRPLTLIWFLWCCCCCCWHCSPHSLSHLLWARRSDFRWFDLILRPNSQTTIILYVYECYYLNSGRYFGWMLESVRPKWHCRRSRARPHLFYLAISVYFRMRHIWLGYQSLFDTRLSWVINIQWWRYRNGRFSVVKKPR